MKPYYQKNKAEKAAKELINQLGKNKKFDGAVILGSGMSSILEKSEILEEISFQSVPGVPVSAVSGHGTKFMSLRLNGKNIMAAMGRVHLYEGYSATEVSFTVSVLGELGIPKIMLTNAAGAVNKEYHVGDLVLINDHLNLQSQSPLTGIAGTEKFQDMTEAYDTGIRQKLSDQFGLQQGVYAGLIGPHYETPAEIRYLRTIGADLVGMSTVQEAIMAGFYGMKCNGISLITNMASGISGDKLSHQEVLEVGKKAEQKLFQIIESWAE